MKTIKIIDPIYHRNVTINISTFIQHQKYIKNYFDIDIDQTGLTAETQYFKNSDSFFIVIWIKEERNKKFLESKDFQSTLGHEILHACFKIFKFLGIEITSDNHECLAYYWEYLYLKALDLLSID